MSVNIEEMIAKFHAKEISEAEFRAAIGQGTQVARPVKARDTLPDEYIPIENLHPAFRSSEQHFSLSRVYTQIPLEPILQSLAALNWLPRGGKGTITTVKPRNQRGINGGRSLETAKHAVTLRNPELEGAGIQRGDRFVQANLVNAHDGTSPLVFMLGIFELVCSNGMTSMRSGFSIRLRHMGLTLDMITAKFCELVANADIMLEQARIMEGIMLTDDQAIKLAEKCLYLRWAPEIENEQHQLIPNPSLPAPSLLLQSLYNRQAKPTLWNVTQNIQRNLLDGGFNVPGKTKSGQRQVTSIRSLDALVRINEQIDHLAYEFARNQFPDVELPIPQTVLEPTYTLVS